MLNDTQASVPPLLQGPAQTFYHGLLAQHFGSHESCLVQYHHIVRPVSCWQVSLPPEIRQFVHASTGNYGKVKLVLQRNAFFVESPFPDVLHTLLQVCYQLISLCTQNADCRFAGSQKWLGQRRAAVCLIQIWLARCCRLLPVVVTEAVHIARLDAPATL